MRISPTKHLHYLSKAKTLFYFIFSEIRQVDRVSHETEDASKSKVYNPQKIEP